MSLLYTPNFKYPEGDLRKNQEFMDSSPHYHQQNHQLHSPSLARYSSAPCSFLESLVNGNSAGGNCEDDRLPSSPEIDNFLAKYMLPCNDSGDSGSLGLQEYGVKAMKQEDPEPLTVQNEYSNGSSQMMATGNGSNLIRQNSSAAGLFSNLGVDNAFAGMRVGGCFRACNGTNGEASTSASRLINRFNYSPGSSSRFLPQIAEEKSFFSNIITSREYMPDFQSNFWDNTSVIGVKRAGDDDCNMSFGLNAYEPQNGNSGNQSTHLVHHLSLPKTSAEIAALEKFLHFQGSVPCKIRAKRGFATHPRSIAERVRRTRISERMRKLQDLFPNMDKQTNTVDMLDLVVEYIKGLQKLVKTLANNKAKCTCSSKQKQY